MKNVINLANRTRNATGMVVETGQDERKNTVLEQIVPEKNMRLHKERTCHIHDLEYYDISYNCLGVSVKDLIANNSEKRSFFSIIRELHRGIIELTNMQSGGIGFINFDSDMASFIKAESDEELTEAFREFFLDLNMNTRKGCEKPYVTFNIGLDTTKNGRKVSMAMLNAFERGDYRGNPFVFPNMVFKLKSGINLEESTVNHDLYQKALAVTAKRMIPTYFNCDSSSNQIYDATSIGIMGCRTRVVANVNGREGSLNRGNVACVTLNLVQMAYQASGDFEKFYRVLNETMIAAKEVLLHRLHTLCQMGIFEEYYEKKYYINSEKRNTFEMLKNGTLSIGFIGLWDAIGTLIGQEINCVDVMKQHEREAFAIIAHMRKLTDRFTEEEKLNFSLLASAAEGVTGNFAQFDNKNLGKGFQACKKGFYTNSYHVPVDVQVGYQDKIALEASFHCLCNGGAITYVEFKEMPGRNIEAVQEVIEYAYEKDCNYIGINFPMDYCVECGAAGRMTECCTCCGSGNIKRLRRVSGYLSEESNFTAGKKKEVQNRSFHIPMDVTKV